MRRERGDRLIDGGPVVGGEALGIGTGIRQDLVALIAALSGAQGAPCRPTEPAVALALQARQVEERGRGLSVRLSGLPRFALYSVNRLRDRARLTLIEQTVVALLLVPFACLELGVKPAGSVLVPVRAKARLDAPVWARHVGQNFQLAIDQQGQRRSLHPPCRPGSTFAAPAEAFREGPGRVHADQPVRA